MTDLEKAARDYHEAHRAATKAQAAQDAAYKKQADARSNTAAWLASVHTYRMAVRAETNALGALAAAALLVPEVF